MSEISPIENRYMGLMRSLDGFTRDKFGIEIIDHDYAPDHDNGLPGYHSLVGFQRELGKLHDDVDGRVMNPEAIRRNIESTSNVIYALPYAVTENSIGDLSLPDYAQKTMGIKPEEISESELAEQREEVEQAAAKLGYEYKEEERERFHAEHSVPAEQLESTVLKLAKVTCDDLIEAAGEKALEDIEEPEVNTVNVADTWEGYFGAKDKKFSIDINTNPIIRISELGERLVLDHERPCIVFGNFQATHCRRRTEPGYGYAALPVANVFPRRDHSPDRGTVRTRQAIGGPRQISIPCHEIRKQRQNEHNTPGQQRDRRWRSL